MVSKKGVSPKGPTIDKGPSLDNLIISTTSPEYLVSLYFSLNSAGP